MSLIAESKHKTKVVLPPHRQGDPEARRIAAGIEAVELPPYVAEVRVELGEYWPGEPDMTLSM